MVRFGKSKVPNLTITQIDLDRLGTQLSLGNKFGTFDFSNLMMFQIYLGQFGMQLSLGHLIFQTLPYSKPIQVSLEHILIWSYISQTQPCLKLTQIVLGYGQVWGIECPKFNYIPDSIWDIPSQIWDRLSEIEIPVQNVPNRNSNLEYSKFNLRHGKVWATTLSFQSGMLTVSHDQSSVGHNRSRTFDRLTVLIDHLTDRLTKFFLIYYYINCL